MEGRVREERARSATAARKREVDPRKRTAFARNPKRQATAQTREWAPGTAREVRGSTRARGERVRDTHRVDSPPMMTSVLLNALPRAAKRAPASAWRVVMNAKKQFSHAGWLVYGPDDSS